MLPYAIIQLLKDKNVLKVMLTFLLSTTMLQTLTIKYWGVFNSAAWYLSALFVLYAIFPILLVIVKAIPRSLTVIAIMIIITIIPAINLLLGFISNQGILSVEIVGLLTQKWPIYWIPVYFAGMMIAKLDYSIQDRAASILEIITIFIVLICYFSGINGPIWLQNYKLVLYMLSGLLLIIVFAQEKGKISQWLAKSKISKFSNYTLEIYLIHYPVSQFFYFMFPSIPKSIFGGIIEVISIFLITCILSFTWKKMIHTVARRKIDKKNE
jgi:peptidoglycan/LPS O-acetylase OafA/YrhL